MSEAPLSTVSGTAPGSATTVSPPATAAPGSYGGHMQPAPPAALPGSYGGHMQPAPPAAATAGAYGGQASSACGARNGGQQPTFLERQNSITKADKDSFLSP